MNEKLYELINNDDVREYYKNNKYELSNSDIAYLIKVQNFPIDKKKELLKENVGEFTNKLLERYTQLEELFKKCDEYYINVSMCEWGGGTFGDEYVYNNLDELLNNIPNYRCSEIGGRFKDGNWIVIDYSKKNGIINYSSRLDWLEDSTIIDAGFYHPFKLNDIVLYGDREFKIRSFYLNEEEVKEGKATDIEASDGQFTLSFKPAIHNITIIKSEDNKY